MEYRLLKVICTVVLVSEDEDGDLIEHSSKPISINAKELPDFSNIIMGKIDRLNRSEHSNRTN